MRLRLLFAVVLTAAIAACGSANGEPSPPSFEETNDIAATSLRDYWVIKTTYSPVKYVPPAVVSYDSPDDLSCAGKPSILKNARMCFPTNTVSFDINFFREGYNQYGQVFVYLILGHEYAHSVQGTVDQKGPDDRFFEVQADCMAGAYIGEMYRLGRLPLTQQDMVNARTIVYSVGDDAPGRKGEGQPSKPDVHGTGQERYESFSKGYTNGVGACGVTHVG